MPLLIYCNVKGISDSQCLLWGRTTPKHLPLPTEDLDSRSNTWFLGPSRITNPNGISIDLAVFAGLTNVINKHKDHATPSVAIGRIQLFSYTAVQPKSSTKF